MIDKYNSLKAVLEELKSKSQIRSSTRILDKKLITATDLYNQITSTLGNSEKHALILEKAKLIYETIIRIIKEKNQSKLKSFKGVATAIIFSNKLTNRLKMANVIEIVKIIPQLIAPFNGDGEKLNSTIAALNACKGLITNDNRAVAIQVVLSRLEGKARAAVGDNPQNIDEIIKKLTDKCKITVAPETVMAKLNATKQVGELPKFTEQIEKLTLDLERAYLNEQVPVDTATRMSVKAGVKALVSGIRSEESKLLLKAGQFTSLSSAIEKITEHEPTSTNKILHVRPNNSGYRGNNYGYRGNNQNPRGRQRGNDRSFRGRNQQSNYRPNYNYSNENNRGYNRGNGRGNSRGNFHNNNSRVFYNSAQPDQMLQGIQSFQNNLGFQQSSPQQQQNQVLLAQPQQNQVALAQLIPRR